MTPFTTGRRWLYNTVIGGFAFPWGKVARR